MHRIVVDVHHWVSDAEFTHLFVIARAAPGPNMLLVTLIGWQVGGLPGALVATGAMCLPSCQRDPRPLTRVNPIWMLAGAGMLGLLGWV